MRRFLAVGTEGEVGGMIARLDPAVAAILGAGAQQQLEEVEGSIG